MYLYIIIYFIYIYIYIYIYIIYREIFMHLYGLSLTLLSLIFIVIQNDFKDIEPIK